MMHKIFTFPLAHWRGQIALWPTIAFTLVGLRVLISSFGGLPFFTLDTCLLIWQVVGSLRALARTQADRPDLATSVVTFAAILVSLPLMGLAHLDRVSGDYQQNLPPQPEAATGVRLVPTYAVLEGPISFAMSTALAKALVENPRLKRLVLQSDGGRVFAARAIVHLVHQYGLSTHVDGSCASACTLIFMAGQSRSLSEGATLGFHGYRQHVYVETVRPDEEEAKDRAAFLAQGISADFAAQVFAAAPESMWFPSRQELVAAGVLTQP